MGRRLEFGWLTARPIAHRGFHDLSAGRPENSLAAFAAAVDAGYAIECDLHLSSDGVPVVFHDNELARLTGETGGVRARTAVELGRLRILGTQERVPTLDALLSLVGGRVPLVIELKHVAGRDAGFAAAVAEKLKGYSGHLALMSFDPRLIAGVKAAAPHLPRGLTADGDWRSGTGHLWSILGIGVDFISYSIDDLPTALPLFARRALGIPLICWTVRRPDQREKAKLWTDQITFEGFAA